MTSISLSVWYSSKIRCFRCRNDLTKSSWKKKKSPRLELKLWIYYRYSSPLEVTACTFINPWQTETCEEAIWSGMWKLLLHISHVHVLSSLSIVVFFSSLNIFKNLNFVSQKEGRQRGTWNAKKADGDFYKMIVRDLLRPEFGLLIIELVILFYHASLVSDITRNQCVVFCASYAFDLIYYIAYWQ